MARTCRRPPLTRRRGEDVACTRPVRSPPPKEWSDNCAQERDPRHAYAANIKDQGKKERWCQGTASAPQQHDEQVTPTRKVPPESMATPRRPAGSKRCPLTSISTVVWQGGLWWQAPEVVPTSGAQRQRGRGPRKGEAGHHPACGSRWQGEGRVIGGVGRCSAAAQKGRLSWSGHEGIG